MILVGHESWRGGGTRSMVHTQRLGFKPTYGPPVGGSFKVVEQLRLSVCLSLISLYKKKAETKNGHQISGVIQALGPSDNLDD